jgi:hypothetical protein
VEHLETRRNRDSHQLKLPREVILKLDEEKRSTENLVLKMRAGVEETKGAVFIENAKKEYPKGGEQETDTAKEMSGENMNNFLNDYSEQKFHFQAPKVSGGDRTHSNRGDDQDRQEDKNGVNCSWPILDPL